MSSVGQSHRSTHNFDVIAGEEYDESIPSHVMRHLTQRRLKMIRSAAKNGRVLDVGCVTGRIPGELDPDSYQRYGIDVSEGMIQHALRKDSLLCCMRASAMQIPYADYLKQAITILDQRPEVGFVGAHYRIFSQHEGACRPSGYELPDMLIENVVPIASIFRRLCWEEVNGYCAKVRFEDRDMWLSILGRGHQAAVIPRALILLQDTTIIAPYPELGAGDLPTNACIYLPTPSNPIEQHISAVLCLKDRQFAYPQAHTLWLEQQVRNWSQAVQEHRDLIASLDQHPKERQDGMSGGIHNGSESGVLLLLRKDSIERYGLFCGRGSCYLASGAKSRNSLEDHVACPNKLCMLNILASVLYLCSRLPLHPSVRCATRSMV